MGDKTDINIDHIAKLARLELSDDEKQRFQSQLGDILSYFEKLASVDVENIEPMAHAFPIYNVWDQDEAKRPFTPEEALRNTQDVRENQIIVPKVVE